MVGDARNLAISLCILCVRSFEKIQDKAFISQVRSRRFPQRKNRTTGESLVRYDKYGNTLELKVRLSR